MAQAPSRHDTRRRGRRARARAIVDAADDGWLDPAGAHSLLEAYGIPLVRERRAETPDEAATVAEELGLPAVVKTAAAGAHKTESGGVALDLRTADEVRAAAARMGGPVIVQQFLTKALSSSPGSCRTRCSAPSSPSGRAACSPS